MQQDSLSLSTAQAQQVADMLDLHAPVQVSVITRHNHVWRIASDEEVFYLKCYTKDWYGDFRQGSDDVPRTEYCVRHECDSYALLARHALPTVEVAVARPDCDNPLGRPFLVTRALPGLSLNQHLAQANAKQFQQLLECTGRYLRQMHEILFAFPGYIIGDGPVAPPGADDWQHPVWCAEACQRNALAMLARDRPRLSPPVASGLDARFANLAAQLAPAYTPLRFVQANMHAHQFFLEPVGASWRVTGVLDMEVASAGSSLFDLVAFALEMAAFHPVATRWWEPFFGGYGGEPDFELFRLHMLTFGEESFKCFGPAQWPGTRDEVLARLLVATTWEGLFVT